MIAGGPGGNRGGEGPAMASGVEPRYMTAAELVTRVAGMTDAMLAGTEEARRGSDVFVYPAEHAHSDKGVLTEQPDMGPLETLA